MKEIIEELGGGMAMITIGFGAIAFLQSILYVMWGRYDRYN